MGFILGSPHLGKLQYDKAVMMGVYRGMSTGTFMWGNGLTQVVARRNGGGNVVLIWDCISIIAGIHSPTHP